MTAPALIQSSVLIVEDMVIDAAKKKQAAKIERELEQQKKRQEIYDLVHPYPWGRNNPKPT